MPAINAFWRSWRGRVLLLVLAALVLVLLGTRRGELRAAYRAWRTDLRDLPLAGATVSYRDTGSGAPALVIISGMSCHKDSYYALQRSLSGITRVISYDRPGLGDSTANSDPRTLDYIDRDLRALLHALRVPPPYVLLGHSLGGHIIRYYADRHPTEVAGLVFLDHPHEDWFDYIRATWSEDEARKYFEWWTADNPEYSGIGREELLAYEKNCLMIRGVTIPPQIPVLMFTANNEGHFRKQDPGRAEDRHRWADMQTSLLSGVKDVKQIVDFDTGHMVHKDKPELVLAEIKSLVERIRTKPAPRSE